MPAPIRETIARQAVATEAVGDVDRQALLGQALDFCCGAGVCRGYFIWLVRCVSCATRSTCAGCNGAIATSSCSDARKSSRLGEVRAARARSARWAYIRRGGDLPP